ncbi:HNH endonuclease signature motif containing protein [Geodermatophilus sp. SYSU D00708]
MLDTQPPRPPDPGVPVDVRPGDLGGPGSELEHVADIWAADAAAARAAAELAVWIAQLARRRRIDRQQADVEVGPAGRPGRDTLDRRPPCLADVSETFVPELALIRGCTEAEAAALAVESLVLVERLPEVWSALYAGRIDRRRAAVLADLLGEVIPEVAARVLAVVLPGAGARPAPALRERTRRVLARIDADALDRRRRAAAARAQVRVQAMDEGLSAFIAEMPTPAAHACADAVARYADLLRAGGDDRPIGVLRAQVTRDLILRPWDTTRPPVTAHLTIHAARPALDPAAEHQPAAEINGAVVTAAQCRELLAQLDMLGLRPAPRGGSTTVAVHDPADGALLAVATRAQLARAAGAPRRHRRRRGPDREVDTATSPRSDSATPRPADTATDAPPDGPGLRPPPPTPRYRPTAAQRRFIRARDRRCRWPGCRRPPARHDLDHVRPHADGGPTACTNLCCLCRTHHRIKTFARHWHVDLLPDGRLLVRTPTGLTRISTPPGCSLDPEPDPPWLDETAPPDPRAG